jgi:hypothetical protein
MQRLVYLLDDRGSEGSVSCRNRTIIWKAQRNCSLGADTVCVDTSGLGWDFFVQNCSDVRNVSPLMPLMNDHRGRQT